MLISNSTKKWICGKKCIKGKTTPWCSGKWTGAKVIFKNRKLWTISAQRCISYRNYSFALLSKQMTGFSMKCNTGLKWVNSLQVSEAYLNPVKNVSAKDRFYNKFHQRLNMFSIAQDMFSSFPLETATTVKTDNILKLWSDR